MKKETKEQIILGQYLRKKRFYCYFELKVMRGKKFYFRNIEKGQKEGLPALQKNGLYWKLSDADMRLKPCDGFCTPPLPTFLIIKTKGSFYFIPYEIIQNMINLGEKGITKEECRKHAIKVIHT